MNSTQSWLNSKAEERARLKRSSEESDKAKAILIETASKDPVFFFNQFCWTYDPRKDAAPNHFPFLTYKFQDEYILALENAYQTSSDFLTEKSRDMGASWIILTWVVWHWLYDKSFNALVGSRKEDLVDNYQLDSLFGKIDYTLQRLPKWLCPNYTRTYCKIVNNDNGNAIQGESANRDFSRQGRYSCCLLDEFAFWEFASSVWTATADSAPVRFPLSTPNGKNNKFAELRFSDQIKTVSLHWSKHPFKDQEWYEREKKRRTPREVAQELDLDYESSGNQKIFPEIRNNLELRENVFIEPFEIPRFWKKRGGLDYGTRNLSSFHVFAHDSDGNDYAIWEWSKNMEMLKEEGFKGSMVMAIAEAIKSCPYYREMDGIMTDPSLWAETQSSQTGMVSLYQQILELGVTNLIQGEQSDLSCIERVRTFWTDSKNPRLKIFKTCSGLMGEMENLTWDDWSERQGIKQSAKEKIIDKDNHNWDSMKYYLMSWPATSKPPEENKKKLYSANWFLEREADLKNMAARQMK
jgi:hypothetical protein